MHSSCSLFLFHLPFIIKKGFGMDFLVHLRICKSFTNVTSVHQCFSTIWVILGDLTVEAARLFSINGRQNLQDARSFASRSSYFCLLSHFSQWELKPWHEEMTDETTSIALSCLCKFCTCKLLFPLGMMILNTMKFRKSLFSSCSLEICDMQSQSTDFLLSIWWLLDIDSEGRMCVCQEARTVI